MKIGYERDGVYGNHPVWESTMPAAHARQQVQGIKEALGGAHDPSADYSVKLYANNGEALYIRPEDIKDLRRSAELKMYLDKSKKSDDVEDRFQLNVYNDE